MAALSSRATPPQKVRVAVFGGAFDPPTKSRMEQAIRDNAAAAQGGGAGGAGTPGRAAAATPAKPTIALKMDFSGFGKK